MTCLCLDLNVTAEDLARSFRFNPQAFMEMLRELAAEQTDAFAMVDEGADDDDFEETAAFLRRLADELDAMMATGTAGA